MTSWSGSAGRPSGGEAPLAIAATAIRCALGFASLLVAAGSLVACGDGMLITLGQTRGSLPSADASVTEAAAPPADVGIADSIVLCPQCMTTTCNEESKTTITGTVYDPAGKVPLYNVIVYVPSAPLDPITEGLSCDRCAGSTSGRPVAATLTNPDGTFELIDTPAGTNIPVVIQIGKWRREITIPTVTPCAVNQVTDTSLTRLPRNSSEGHLPQMALTTGHSDALECLLRKIGIDDREFTTEAGTGRVHMFVGCPGDSGTGANQFMPELGGAKFTDATVLFANDQIKLSKYDMLVFSCEGTQCGSVKKPFIQNIKDYADHGGRLFLDHLHSYWLRMGADPWPDTADYVGVDADLPTPFAVKVDTSFPKGDAFAQWLVATTAQPYGTITIQGAQFTVRAARPPISQQWIYTDMNPEDSSGNAVEYMTMNTPVELASTLPDQQCGRVVFTDLHVVLPTGVDGGTGAVRDVSHADKPFPSGCVDADLTPQEKALEFMLFDLSSCVQKETDPPKAPPIIIR